MSRALVTLHSTADRERVAHWAAKAPAGTRVEFKAAQRTLPQNDRMWAMLTDVSSQKQHCERHYTPDQWKVIFMHACGQEVQFIPSLDNKTFIPWGQRSSDLGKDEMSELIDFIAAWGAENGVHFNDPADELEPSDSSEVSPPEPHGNPAPEHVSASGAGALSQSSAAPLGETANAADGERQATEPGDSALHGSAGLPDDWPTLYVEALGCAVTPGKLSRLAANFWDAHGGYDRVKADAAAYEKAESIYAAFRDNFGPAKAEARNAALRELNAI